MEQERKQMQVFSQTKQIVQDLKKSLGLKNESEVIAYLYAIYEMKFEKLTVIEDMKARERIKEIHNQAII